MSDCPRSFQVFFGVSGTFEKSVSALAHTVNISIQGLERRFNLYTCDQRIAPAFAVERAGFDDVLHVRAHE